MWSNNERKQLQFVAGHLNEIIAVTHYMKLDFDLDHAQVNLYNLTDANNKNIIGTVNVQDDSPRAFIDDVLREIESL